MSIELNYPFDIPGNYIYDSNKIEVSGGSARIKLRQDDVDFTEDFADDTDFTYDSDEAEFTGGLVRQKDTRPSNATFYVSYNSDINGSWGNGVLTGTAIGGASVSGGYLDLSQDDVRYVDYNADLNADSQQTGCIRFEIVPNYNSSPATEQRFFLFCKAHNNTENLIFIRHSAGGALRLHMFGIGGAFIFEKYLGSWTVVQGQKYEIEVNWDIDSGATRVFIDGVQKGTTETTTGTRSSDIGLLRIGSDRTGVLTANFSINNILIFSTVQHTTDYTPDWSSIYETIYFETSVTLPEMEHTGDGTIKLFNSFSTTESGSPRYTLQIGRSGDYLYWNGSVWTVSDDTYSQANDVTTFNANCGSLDVDGENYGQFKIIFPESISIQSSVSELTANMNVDIGYYDDNPTIEPNSSFQTDELISIIETATKNGNDEIKYIVKIADIWYWLNNGILEESDETYTQANTEAELNANIENLISAASVCKIKLFLHSEDTTTTPILNNLYIEYSFGGETVDVIEKCIVWGYNFDCEGNREQTQITIKLNRAQAQYKNYTTIKRTEISVTPDANGYWEVELVENANMENNTGYIFDFNNGERFRRIVPNEQTKNFYLLEA